MQLATDLRCPAPGRRDRFYFLPQAGYLLPDLSARDNVVPVLGETDRSALAKARACASDQNSLLAHMTCFLVHRYTLHLTN